MTLSLPSSWADVTIAQYYKLLSISNLFKEDAVMRSIKTLSLFSGQSEKEIEQMNITLLLKEIKQLSFLGSLPADKKLSITFKLKNNIYKAILITSDMQAGQFMDFSHCGKGCTPEELPYHMHELIACMSLRKVKSIWQYKPYTETAEDFLDMPISQAYPYYVFFCNVLINLQKPILDYSLTKIKKMAKTEKKEIKKILESV